MKARDISHARHAAARCTHQLAALDERLEVAQYLLLLLGFQALPLRAVDLDGQFVDFALRVQKQRVVSV